LNTSPNFNATLPALINLLVPAGLKGLIAASMAAALMSCMAAALNGCATLISIDVLKRLRPATSDARVVLVGRITTGLVMGLAMLWSTQGDQFGTIFEAVNKIPMTFAPAVTTVFVLGVTWKRGTRQAAMATLYAGSIIGGLYFIGDLPGLGRLLLGGQAREGFAGLVTDPVQGVGIPFMLVGPIITVACVGIYVATSLLTPTMDEKAVAEVCWKHPLDFVRGPIDGPGDPRVVSVALLTLVGALYYVLR
jgi:SSS family solute:Na+ symporter